MLLSEDDEVEMELTASWIWSVEVSEGPIDDYLAGSVGILRWCSHSQNHTR